MVFFFKEKTLEWKYYKKLPLFQLDLPPILSLDHRISPAHSQITFLIPLPPPQLGRACGPNTGREGQQKPHRTPRGSPHPLPMASRTRSSVMFCACWTPQARSLMISQGCLTRSRTKISITKSTHLYIIILNWTDHSYIHYYVNTIMKHHSFHTRRVLLFYFILHFPKIICYNQFPMEIRGFNKQTKIWNTSYYLQLRCTSIFYENDSAWFFYWLHWCRGTDVADSLLSLHLGSPLIFIILYAIWEFIFYFICFKLLNILQSLS